MRTSEYTNQISYFHKRFHIGYTTHMESVLLLHVLAMSASLVVTIISLVIAALGIRIKTSVLRTNVAVTVVGIACGVALIAAAPLGIQCIVLSAYTAGFWAAMSYVSRRNAQLTLSAS